MKLPRAQAGSAAYVLEPDAWNYVCDVIESVSSLHVAPPLSLNDDPAGGKMLSIIGDGLKLPAKITGSETGGGFYKGRILQGRTTVNGGGTNLTMPAGLTPANVDNLLIYVPAESGFSSHPLFPGTNSTALNGAVLVTSVTNESPPRMVGEWLGATILPGELFAVALTQTGGANGTDTSAPTYTYTVKDLAGNTLGTAKAPITRPNSAGSVTAATTGDAYWDSSGTIILKRADEVWNTSTDCA